MSNNCCTDSDGPNGKLLSVEIGGRGGACLIVAGNDGTGTSAVGAGCLAAGAVAERVLLFPGLEILGRFRAASCKFKKKKKRQLEIVMFANTIF